MAVLRGLLTLPLFALALTLLLLAQPVLAADLGRPTWQHDGGMAASPLAQQPAQQCRFVLGFAALPKSAIAQRLFVQPHRPRDVGPEVDAVGLLQPGLAVSAYLNDQPDASHLPAKTLRARLQALGLPLRDLARVDLEGDGHMAIVALLPAGATISGWIVTRPAGGRWRALAVAGPERFVGIGTSRPRPGGAGDIVPLIISGAPQPSTTLVGLVHGKLRYQAADGASLPVEGGAGAVGCNLADGLAPA